ncbi:beclin 1-associated autophagy-related key regulator isoform X2 [Diorhabda sublineata]|uniref:beclin 1-associated autophagy-related key regulator isoform X2 n=1 Tax=Diorhabda sublineata TaxID=1163346 RepID=UPI0024E18787|nr:beclin 1-associated autophagy-related key regulator isoform X2 [Diorhabda sublineata]
MATTSSSEDSTAPRDFHLSSSTDSGSRLSPNRQRCPLCRKFRKVFYCKECIHSGLFYSSKQKIAESCFEKQRALLELEDNKNTLEKNCLKLLDNRRKSDILSSKIRQAKDRTKILRLALEEKRYRRTINNTSLATLRDKNERGSKSLPKYDNKVHEIESFVCSKQEKVEKTRDSVKEKQEELKKLVKLRIQQLFKYIFPITIVNPNLEIERSTDSMVNALAEASQSTDRWDYSYYTGETRYCIAGPTLPVSGNYSAYNIWVAQNQDGVPNSNIASSVEINPAYSISAALTYTAQLISVLSYYLNIKLPYKMQYSDYSDTFMNEQRFARRTARLNANILYLCFHQKVDLTSLNSTKTIHNILQLIENSSTDLGDGPVQYDFNRAVALAQNLSSDLKTNEDSDSEEGDSFPAEWEAVPHVQCPEISAGPAISQAPQMISTQQASSMAGGLVNSAAASIASIWRGFTGRISSQKFASQVIFYIRIKF